METVVHCTKLKEVPSKFGGPPVVVYSVGLSDGRGGESFKNYIAPGTPVDQLTIEEGQYGLKISPKKEQKSGGGGSWGGNKGGGNASFALSYSKDLVVAGKVDIKQILPTADKLYDWLESKKPAPVVLASQLPQKTKDAIAAAVLDDNSLPF